MGQKFGAVPKELWRPQNIKIWGKFRRTSQLVREFLRIERHRKSSNGKRRRKPQLLLARLLNFVNFGPQTAETGTVFRPTQRASVAWVTFRTSLVRTSLTWSME